MNKKTILNKLLILAFLENLLPAKDRTAKDLIRSTLKDINSINTSDSAMYEQDSMDSLKTLILNLVNALPTDQYTLPDVTNEVKLCLINDGDYLDITLLVLEALPDVKDLKKIKKELRKIKTEISRYYREAKLEETIQDAAATMKFKKASIPSLHIYVEDLITTLSSNNRLDNISDPAIVTEVDLSNPKAVKNTCNNIDDTNTGDADYILGLKKLNVLMAGGLRLGEEVVIPALEHKNKTGLSLTIIRQLMTYNKPKLKDPTKKPLILRIAFEGKVLDDIRYLYRGIMINKTKKFVPIKGLPVDEMMSYISKHLCETGFHIKLLRVNPNDWSYMAIQEYWLQLESEGYEIHLFNPDYLGMVPTTGCIKTGAPGTDLRDLFRRMGGFASAKNAILLTPHQLSPNVKDLLLNGVEDRSLLPKIISSTPYSGSRQIAQEVDLELYTHLVKHTDGRTYQHIVRGKHRGPAPIADIHKAIFIPLPDKGMPIMDDVNTEDDICLHTLPMVQQQVDF